MATYVAEQAAPYLDHDTAVMWVENMWTYSIQELFGLTVDEIQQKKLPTGSCVWRTLANPRDPRTPQPEGASIEDFYTSAILQILAYIWDRLRFPQARTMDSSIQLPFDYFRECLVRIDPSKRAEYDAMLTRIFITPSKNRYCVDD